MRTGKVALFGFLILIFSCSDDSGRKDLKIVAIPENNVTFKRSLLTDLVQKISQKPDDPELYIRKSYLEEELNNKPKAIEDIKTAIKLKPDDLALRFRLGELLNDSGELDGSFEQFQFIFNKDPAYPDIISKMIEQYFLMGDYDKAFKLAEETIGAEVDDPDLNYAFAELHLKKGDTATAMKLFNKVIRLDSTEWRAYLKISEIYLQEANVSGSYKYLTEAYLLNPEDIGLNISYGRSLLKSENYDSAQSIFKKALELEESEEVILELGRILYHKGMLDSTLVYAETLIEKYDNPEGKLLKARILDEKRNFNESLKLYNEILKQDSTHEIAREELNILERKIAYLRILERRRNDTIQTKEKIPIKMNNED